MRLQITFQRSLYQQREYDLKITFDAPELKDNTADLTLQIEESYIESDFEYLFDDAKRRMLDFIAAEKKEREIKETFTGLGAKGMYDFVKGKLRETPS